MAKTLVKAMPGTVIRRLLDDEGFSSFAELSVLGYGDVGSFRHGEILSALESAKDGNGKADLTTRNGRHFVLTRMPGEAVALAEGGEACRLISEFGFLDPEQEVRFAALNDAVGQCWPGMPSAEKWRFILAERPLSEIEFARLISEIRETPSQFLAVLERKWMSGAEMGADDFFPTSLAYFSALIGPPPDGNAVDGWINGVLTPDLQQTIRLSLDDGLKRALALNIDPRLSPVRLVEDVPAVQLLTALSGLVKSVSPIALLGILEIALARVEDDGGFSSLASDALERLFGEKGGKSKNTTAWKLMPALVRAGLGKISISEELWSLPPFWRRLAACAHAQVLVELLEADGKDVDRFIDWLGGLETEGEVAAFLLDMSEEPLWRAWDLSPRQLRASVVSRLMAMKASLDGLGLGGIVDLAVEALKAESGLFDANRPGPLVDCGARMSDLGGREGMDSEVMSEFFSQALAELDLDPAGDAWKGMSVTCRLLRFDEALLDMLAIIVGRISMGEGDAGKWGFFETLLLAADIAASQPFELLADAVASALVREASRFTEEVDVVTGYRILVISSGAIRNRIGCMDWAGNRMSDYAFSLPRGEACRRLLVDLDALQTLLPIRERCFGRARKFAAAGMN